MSGEPEGEHGGQLSVRLGVLSVSVVVNGLKPPRASTVRAVHTQEDVAAVGSAHSAVASGRHQSWVARRAWCVSRACFPHLLVLL